jgi:hypothetical protein
VGNCGWGQSPDGQQREIPFDYVCRLGIGWFSDEASQTALRPITKCRINEITANTSNK